MNGTNTVMPMGGTNSVGPMGGTNSVNPMGDTNNVFPMGDTDYFDAVDMSVPVQLSNGSIVYVHPLAAMTPDQVPMQGVDPMDTDEDIAVYRAAYMLGDEDAMNGIRDWKMRRQERRQERQERKQSRKAEKESRRATRKDRREKGTRFIDKFGTGLLNVSEGLKAKNLAEASAVQAGIEPDDGVLTQRAMITAGSGGGMAGWWGGLSTPAKIGLGVGALLVVGGGIYLVTRKKKKSRR